jgi:hypothetical protein
MKGLAVTLALCLGAATAQAAESEGYPTAARVDYVLGCMSANSMTQEMMTKCSCSIDRIAAEIPYNDYVELETVRRMQDVGGERGGVLRNTGWVRDLQERFRLAQVQADLECFH